MLVVGIDPGERKTGIAWIRRAKNGAKISRCTNVIFATQNQLHIRWALLRRKIESFFKGLPEPPVSVAVEVPGDWIRDGVPLTSILRLHAAYAVIVSEVSRICPQACLMAVKPGAWNGSLEKSDTWAAMERKYQGKITSDDAADALGIADYAFSVALKVFASKA